MWPMSRSRGPPARPSNVPTTVSPSRPSGRAGLDGRAEAARGTRAVQRPTSSTPALRVAAAVDVDERCEVVEVGRAARPRGRREGGELGRADGGARRVTAMSCRRSLRPRGRSSARYPARTVRLVEIRLLEGPNVYRLEPVVKVEVAVGRRRTWYGQRDPAAMRSSASGATSRPATGRTTSPRWSPGSAGCVPSTARAAAAWPSIARRTRGTGSSRSRGPAPSGRRRIAEAALALGRARRLARPGRARLTGDPGAAARPLARPDRDGAGNAAGAGSATRTGGSRSCRSAGRTARAR